MKLYNFAWGPYPRRVSLYLAEKRVVDLQLIEVEFPHRPERWPPDFLQSLNPAHSLPVLELESGVRIGQSIAILEYLEERYPQPNMIGATPEARARTREMVAIFEEAAAFFGLWARQGSRINAERHTASLEAAAIGAERFSQKLAIAERVITGPFLCGNSFTIADCVALALLEFTEQFYGVAIPAGHGKLNAWYARASQRPRKSRPVYPPEMLSIARGLPEQTRCFIA